MDLSPPRERQDLTREHNVDTFVDTFGRTDRSRYELEFLSKDIQYHI